jgi:hypothetical protein
VEVWNRATRLADRERRGARTRRTLMMQLQEQLLAIERKLWTNDAVFYKEHFLEDALLVFPETGVITRDVAVNAIRTENAEGRRWAEVEFSDIRSVPLTSGAHLLSYRVAARWEHEMSKIFALATTVYVERNGAWSVALHQQTPIAAQ